MSVVDEIVTTSLPVNGVHTTLTHCAGFPFPLARFPPPSVTVADTSLSHTAIGPFGTDSMPSPPLAERDVPGERDGERTRRALRGRRKWTDQDAVAAVVEEQVVTDGYGTAAATADTGAEFDRVAGIRHESIAADVTTDTRAELHTDRVCLETGSREC